MTGYIPFDDAYLDPPLVAIRGVNGGFSRFAPLSFRKEGNTYVGLYVMGAYWGFTFDVKIDYRVYVHTKLLPPLTINHGIRVRDLDGNISFDSSYKYLKIAAMLTIVPPTTYDTYVNVPHPYVGPDPYYIISNMRGQSRGHTLGVVHNTSGLSSSLSVGYMHRNKMIIGSAFMEFFYDYSVFPSFSAVVVDPR